MNKIFLIIISLGSLAIAQVSADLTIANQQVVGTDFFFDIYITRTGTNDLYLGTADFVLTFNADAFTGDTLIRSSSSFWNLTSTNLVSVGSSYRTATSIAQILGNEIIINLNQVLFSDQDEFDDNVARIDNAPNTHRFGRYRVAGINNPSAFMNLQWKTSGTGVTTQVFTLASVSPWVSSAVTINAVNPGNASLPVELTSFTATINSANVVLKWSTASEVNNYGFEIERSVISNEERNLNWQKIGFVSGSGNSSSPKEYSFRDNKLLGGCNFAFRLKQVDNDGQFE